MDKDELINLKRKLISFGSAGIITLLSLTSCSKPLPDVTCAQSIQTSLQDLADDSSKLIVTVRSLDNRNYIHLVAKKTISDLQLYSDYKEYDKYFNIDKATAGNTYIYIDVITLEVVAVKYIKEDNHILGKKSQEESFLSNEILKEEPAFLYAKEYFGVKKEYTFIELEDMMNNLRKDKNSKQYSK